MTPTPRGSRAVHTFPAEPIFDELKMVNSAPRLGWRGAAVAVVDLRGQRRDVAHAAAQQGSAWARLRRVGEGAAGSARWPRVAGNADAGPFRNPPQNFVRFVEYAARPSPTGSDTTWFPSHCRAVCLHHTRGDQRGWARASDTVSWGGAPPADLGGTVHARLGLGQLRSRRRGSNTWLSDRQGECMSWTPMGTWTSPSSSSASPSTRLATQSWALMWAGPIWSCPGFVDT